MNDPSKWWTEDRRGQTIGHGIRWGNKWAHITKITDDGPGANGIRSLCGGVQSVMLVNSALDIGDQAACEDWKHEGVRFPLDCAVEDVVKERRLASICPKCKTIYDRRRA